MTDALRRFIRVVDTVNRRIGRLTMYLLFGMMAILLWSSVSKTFFTPSLWTLEMAQFSMMTYFIVGGAYAIQMRAHVRMDLLYGEWSPRTRALVDAVTVLFLLFYLVMVLYGGLLSTGYALEYNERSRTAWRPYMWPIKAIICFGVALMILQSLSELAKDVLRLKGEPFPDQAEGEAL